MLLFVGAHTRAHANARIHANSQTQAFSCSDSDKDVRRPHAERINVETMSEFVPKRNRGLESGRDVWVETEKCFAVMRRSLILHRFCRTTLMATAGSGHTVL